MENIKKTIKRVLGHKEKPKPEPDSEASDSAEKNESVEISRQKAETGPNESDSEKTGDAENTKTAKRRGTRRRRPTKKKTATKPETVEESEKTDEPEKQADVKEQNTEEKESKDTSSSETNTSDSAEVEEKKEHSSKSRRRRRSKSKKDKESKDNPVKIEDDSREEDKKEDKRDRDSGQKKTSNVSSNQNGIAKTKKDRRDMVINITSGQECRIAVISNNKLEELYVERLDSESLVGNIYKGKIVNIEPSIQACFVDFGIGQNGFLHISDVQASYFKNGSDQGEKVGKKHPRKTRPLIQESLKKGQEIVVQVIKSGIGTKGPTLSSYISIPGRYVVLMPGMKHSGVSRKLTQEDRQKMKELSSELSAPEDVGLILRTASLNSNKRELKKDFNYLLRLWKQMSRTIKIKSGPIELYKESDLVIRTIRDVFSTGVDGIICDDEDTCKKIKEFFTIAMPRTRNKVKYYSDHEPLFSKYKLEREIQKLQSKTVPLLHGGSIVIESTEAMVTIDVNSGKYRENQNAEDTAFKTNMEAAEEICRQLKLRDLGGVVVIDFIDMATNKNKRALEKEVKDLFTKDRASTRILRINQFGLMAITRQRMKASLKNRTYMSCPLCKGTGHLKSPESVSIEVMRKINYAVEDPKLAELDVKVAPEVACYLLNNRRSVLSLLEEEHNVKIVIKSDPHRGPEQAYYEARNNRGIIIDPWL